MDNVKWYIGKVVDNDDPDKKGRVRAILYEIDSQDEDTENLVWCYPEQEGQNIPEVDDKFWFKVVDRYLRKRFYTVKVQRETYNDYNFFDDEIKDNIDDYAGEYPFNKGFFTKKKNGIVFCSDTGETCLLGKSAYIFINEDDEIIMKSGTATVEASVLGETLKDLLSDLLDGLLALTVPTGTGPSGTPINASTFTQLKSDLENILSQKIKNN